MGQADAATTGSPARTARPCTVSSKAGTALSATRCRRRMQEALSKWTARHDRSAPGTTASQDGGSDHCEQSATEQRRDPSHDRTRRACHSTAIAGRHSPSSPTSHPDLVILAKASKKKVKKEDRPDPKQTKLDFSKAAAAAAQTKQAILSVDLAAYRQTPLQPCESDGSNPDCADDRLWYLRAELEKESVAAVWLGPWPAEEFASWVREARPMLMATIKLFTQKLEPADIDDPTNPPLKFTTEREVQQAFQQQVMAPLVRYAAGAFEAVMHTTDVRSREMRQAPSAAADSSSSAAGEAQAHDQAPPPAGSSRFSLAERWHATTPLRNAIPAPVQGESLSHYLRRRQSELDKEPPVFRPIDMTPNVSLAFQQVQERKRDAPFPATFIEIKQSGEMRGEGHTGDLEEWLSMGGSVATCAQLVHYLLRYRVFRHTNELIFALSSLDWTRVVQARRTRNPDESFTITLRFSELIPGSALNSAAPPVPTPLPSTYAVVAAFEASVAAAAVSCSSASAAASVNGGPSEATTFSVRSIFWRLVCDAYMRVLGASWMMNAMDRLSDPSPSPSAVSPIEVRESAAASSSSSAAAATPVQELRAVLQSVCGPKDAAALSTADDAFSSVERFCAVFPTLGTGQTGNVIRVGDAAVKLFNAAAEVSEDQAEHLLDNEARVYKSLKRGRVGRDVVPQLLFAGRVSIGADSDVVVLITRVAGRALPAFADRPEYWQCGLSSSDADSSSASAASSSSSSSPSSSVCVGFVCLSLSLLHSFHEAGYLHGDPRVENFVFDETSKTMRLIDLAHSQVREDDEETQVELWQWKRRVETFKNHNVRAKTVG